MEFNKNVNANGIDRIPEKRDCFVKNGKGPLRRNFVSPRLDVIALKTNVTTGRIEILGLAKPSGVGG